VALRAVLAHAPRAQPGELLGDEGLAGEPVFAQRSRIVGEGERDVVFREVGAGLGNAEYQIVHVPVAERLGARVVAALADRRLAPGELLLEDAARSAQRVLADDVGAAPALLDRPGVARETAGPRLPGGRKTGRRVRPRERRKQQRRHHERDPASARSPHPRCVPAQPMKKAFSLLPSRSRK
jgi:hypothetical protein